MHKVRIVSILGCGWFGFPLAKKLVASNFIVNGSTKTRSKIEILQKEKINPFLLQVDSELSGDNLTDFFKSEILIINIPPPRTNDGDTLHLRQIKSIVINAKQGDVSFIIFISSTSVYSDVNGIVSEDDKPTPTSLNGIALKSVEDYLLNESQINTTVIRFGGLIGPGRHPVKYFAGRTNIAGGNAPLNLIHIDDCISIVEFILSKNISNQIINAVCDDHPTKKIFYTDAASKRGLALPLFNNVEDDYIIVSPQKLMTQFGYKFIYNNPLDFPIDE